MCLCHNDTHSICAGMKYKDERWGSSTCAHLFSHTHLYHWHICVFSNFRLCALTATSDGRMTDCTYSEYWAWQYGSITIKLHLSHLVWHSCIVLLQPVNAIISFSCPLSFYWPVHSISSMDTMTDSFKPLQKCAVKQLHVPLNIQKGEYFWILGDPQGSASVCHYTCSRHIIGQHQMFPGDL